MNTGQLPIYSQTSQMSEEIDEVNNGGLAYFSPLEVALKFANLAKAHLGLHILTNGANRGGRDDSAPKKRSQAYGRRE